MAETQGTGTATQQPPKPEPKSTPKGQPAAPQTDTPQAQPQTQTPADADPKTTDKPAEKPIVETGNKRTQGQFDKLLESNKRLYDANDALRTQLTTKALATEQFAPIQQPPVQQPAQEVNVADFVEVNPQTGEKFIDDKKLQAKITEVNDKATQSEEAVKRYIQTSEQKDIDRQNEVAFTAYPELDPDGEKFDNRFHNQTRAIIYDSLINPADYGGRPLSFVKAADFVKEGNKVPDNEKNQQASASEDKPEGQTAAEDQTQEGEDAKQQAAASVAGEQPDTREALAGSEELEKLQQATRLGNREALARRIANTDHIVKDEEPGETTS